MSEMFPGFKLGRGWGADDAPDLSTMVDSLAWEQTKVRVFGKEYPTPRLTAWTGTGAYTYSGIAQIEFSTAALAAAKAHNVLTAEDRDTFAACSDPAELEAWSGMVVHDLSMRCRSFTPPVLANLIKLCHACL